ncbi:serine/threonine-protein kinase [Spongiactinospora sp. TRM90649]|uniref:serine/threonine-protein kinase n=1 Tax=Spongiactinospora sp. TRM90649 TaxID=3031114 RepID=UPI0023F61768|nr:serine/threonine-protein kinase [Spongiactinospora sp. TRM90649]MDF5757711.1 serine/threonine-protein kinase [Spongiactinospora sp. TRM90649]
MTTDPGAERLNETDPETIGPYRLLGRLGEGGMGTVYLAVAPTGRLVAVKVVKAEFAVVPGFATRFHAEVDNARRVASFCTAQVLDNGDDGERPYMVTEYIEGLPLSRQITRYGALEPGPLHGVALGVAAALAAIHVAGLVHRDLKPANVILSISGPRVIDFGISRALDRTQGVTLSGELLGSPGWWAPEQVRGLAITPAADIFSWGCLVAYAGNGRHPYGRGDAITLATRVLNGQPDLGVLPAPLNELVRRATSQDPAERPTAQELVLALVGGGIAAPAPAFVPEESPPTLVADEMLAESWQPPSNIGGEVTQTLGRLGLPSPPGGPDTLVPFEQGLPDVQYTTTAPTPKDPRPPRTGGKRWLLAAAAAVTALAVTGAVLVITQGRGTVASPPGKSAPVVANRVTDVGRRMPLGPFVTDPQLVIPQPPSCGLTSYGEATPRRGRFCAVRWVLLNTGGELVALDPGPITLFDDRGAGHDPEPVSTTLPSALTPGAKVDGVLVYDLPPSRSPAKLSGRLIDGGRQIEVRL